MDGQRKLVIPADVAKYDASFASSGIEQPDSHHLLDGVVENFAQPQSNWGSGFRARNGCGRHPEVRALSCAPRRMAASADLSSFEARKGSHLQR
jgi:hypothetical protein